jgi:hypothetical protein
MVIAVALADTALGQLYIGLRPHHSWSALATEPPRTVPLVAELVPIIDWWAAGKEPEAWLFATPGDGPLQESN